MKEPSADHGQSAGVTDLAERDLTEDEYDQLTDYQRGYIDGVSAYAWWKDGTQYVGTTGRTRRQAIAAFLRDGR